MNIRLLGTGAADGIPALYGNDAVSRYAREHGGKDVRTRTAALVDGTLKIDLGPDTNAQMLRDRLDARDWTALVFTHSDDDHINANELQYALYPFTEFDHLPYTIYANSTVLAKIRNRYPDWPMELVETHSFECFDHDSYQITPVRARHIPTEDCQNLLIQRGGKTFFYASDTGFPYDETFAFLRRYSIDAMVIECTDGVCNQEYEGHLNVEECVAVVERMRREGSLRADSLVFTTHHSVRGAARHCDLERLLRPHGIEPGYDGLVIDL